MQHKKTAVCTKCLKRRKVDDFAKHQARGRWCRDCYTDYFKSYNLKRYASPEARAAELERSRLKYAADIRPKRWERKRTLVAMMGGQCCLCGYKKCIAALDFDHIGNHRTARGQPNPNKRRTISHLLAVNTENAFEQAVEEAKQCQILCSNCHRERTFSENAG